MRSLTGVLLLCAALSAACNPFEPTLYDYSLSFSNTQRHGWPVWIEEVEFEHDGAERWRSSAGSLGGGDGEIPPGLGALAALGKLPVPQKMFVRWFSNRTQRYYEAHLDLPKDVEAQVQTWFKRFPVKQDYGHVLNLVVGGDGEVMVWWFISCHRKDGKPCGFDTCRSTPRGRSCYYDSYPLIRSARGHEVPGDPEKYSADTQQYRREGEFP